MRSLSSHSDATCVTFTVGQAVPWRAAPCGVAQIADLFRTRVRICYPTKRGCIRFATVRAAELAERIRREPLLLSMRNPFNRGVVTRAKTFALRSPPPPDLYVEK